VGFLVEPSPLWALTMAGRTRSLIVKNISTVYIRKEKKTHVLALDVSRAHFVAVSGCCCWPLVDDDIMSLVII
jgi:hypothetical protein